MVLNFILLFGCMHVFAQHRVYCEIVGTEKLNLKVKIEVDFGQAPSKGTFRNTGKTLVDENGKEIEFYSMVDAMNYMGELGWKFVQAYAITHGAQLVYHFLLCKDISDEEYVNDGLNTMGDFKNNQGKQ